MTVRAASGYVISPRDTTWLYDFRTRWQSPQTCMGDPTELPRTVPIDLRAKLATLHYQVQLRLGLATTQPQVHEAAMRRLDAMGRYFAVMLRGELGAGPIIVYNNAFRDRCGGPRAWQVGDEGELLPYRHRPSAGYVLDHEACGEWAWEYDPAHQYMIGWTAGHEWFGEQPLSTDLLDAFQAWHTEWSNLAYGKPPSDLAAAWAAHNAKGLDLAWRLKQVVGATYKVIYLRPFEEPCELKEWTAVEVRLDGSRRIYEHFPYWTNLSAATRDGPA